MIRRQFPCLAFYVFTIAFGCADTNRQTVQVYAASSLLEAFQDLKTEFEGLHPGAKISLNHAGSQTLRLQISRGAPADVYASANAEHMKALIETKHIGEARAFAQNRLTIIVPDKPGSLIRDVKSLSRAKRLVLGTRAVPVGQYARDFIERAQLQFKDDYLAQVDNAIVSEESNSRLVRSKVQLGEADAAIVYTSDAHNALGIRAVNIPNTLNPKVTYLIGQTPKGMNNPTAIRWTDFVLSKRAQSVFKARGFEVVNE